VRSWKSSDDSVALKFLIFGVYFIFWDVCSNNGISSIVRCIYVSSERQAVISFFMLSEMRCGGGGIVVYLYKYLKFE
jgi:hypothetical protein